MKKMLILTCVLLPVITLGHQVFTKKLPRILKESEAVAFGIIENIETDKQYCSTRTKYTIRLQKFLQGHIKQKSITFYYSVYYWKKARWFWQDDCPSVSYMVPPMAKTMRKGAKVIVAIKKYNNKYYGIGIFDLAKEKNILRILRNK